MNSLLNPNVTNLECPMCNVNTVNIESKVWRRSELCVVPDTFETYVNNVDSCKEYYCPIKYVET